MVRRLGIGAWFCAVFVLVGLVVSGRVWADGEAAGAGRTNPTIGMHDLAGEACHTTPRHDIAPDPSAPHPVYLMCGAHAGRPNGAVAAIAASVSLPKATAARHGMLEKMAAKAPAGRDAAARMTCKSGHWMKSPDGIDMLVRSCTLIDGNWPQILVVARIRGYVFQAEGLPALLPALEAEMAAQADYSPRAGAPAFGGEAWARAVLAKVFGAKVRMIGSAALDRYANLVEKARLYGSRKDFRAAENAYRQALDLQERAFGDKNIGVATTLLNLGLMVSNQGRFAEAAGLFRRADPIIQAANNPLYRARNFEYLGFDAANRGKFEDALRYAIAAIKIWRDMISSNTPAVEELGSGSGSEVRRALQGELAHTLNLAAAMAWRVGKLTYAEAAAKEALGIVTHDPDLPPWWGPDILMTLGNIFSREGRLRRAEESLRGALIFNERLFGNSAPTAIALLAIGRVYAVDGLYDESLRAFKYALDILGKSKIARSLLVFDQLAPLVTTVNALAKQHPDRRDALDAVLFRAIQYMSAGVTDQTITRASARLASGDPAIEKLVRDLQDAQRRRDAARMTLAYESSLPQDQRSGDKERALLKAVNDENDRSLALAAQIHKKFPAYYQLTNPQPVTLSNLQKQLHPGEAVVEFAFGHGHAAVFFVTKRAFVARPIPTDQAEIAASVKAIRQVLEARNGRIQDFDLTEAYHLYRTLFGPIQNQLTGVKHLIVVPGNALASLPLALLVTEPPRAGARNYRAAAWLVRRYGETVVPSVEAFVTLRDRAQSKEAPRAFLGIGNPDFTGTRGGRGASSALERLATRCRGDGPLPAVFLRALAPLPETAAEVTAVAKTFGAGPNDLLLGKAATEAAFRDEPLDQFRVIYFATHGLLPGELDCATEPALALSPPSVPATTKSQDGLLEASEIAGLHLNADLVVLSACDTAEGGTKLGGEALAGVAQSFFFAGARTLVASHWQVPSRATETLMVGMFKDMQNGVGIAEALRRSQLAVVANPATANPFYWAAFTVIGDGDSWSSRQADTRRSRQAALLHRGGVR